MRILSFNFETALGAAVHATPVFEGLRSAAPTAHVTCLSAGVAADVLSANPNIDTFLRVPHAWQQPRELALWLLRNRSSLGSFDVAIFNTGNCRTSVVGLSFLLKIKRRVGYSVQARLVDEHLVEDERLSLIGNNLRLLELLGHAHTDATYPQVWFSAEQANEAFAWRASLQDEESSRPVVAYFAGTSGGHPNQWFDDRFVQVADAMQRSHGAVNVFFGGPSDEQLAVRLASACKVPGIPLAGRTSVTTLAARIAACDLVVSVDTGGLHVAWAVGTPTVVIGHAANPKHIWLPASNPKVWVIRKDNVTPCSGCRKTACATRECMDAINIDEVVYAACVQLAQISDLRQARAYRLRQWTPGPAAIETASPSGAPE